MRNALFGLLCANLLLVIVSVHAINIRDAIKQKLIKTEVRWRAEENQESVSLRHGKNLCLSITNCSSRPLEVEVPVGFMFTSADSSKQNMLIAEEMNYSIPAAKRQTKYAHAYCCEAHDSSPNVDATYLIKKPASTNLQKLAEFVHQNKMEGYGVQRAVWCISDNYDLSDIDMQNAEQTKKLMEFTGNLRGMDQKEVALACRQAAKRGVKVFEKMVSIEIPIENDTYMWILIQDINNTTVKTVMTKQLVKKGVFKKEVGLSSIDMGSGTFIIRAYSTSNAVVEKKVSLDI